MRRLCSADLPQRLTLKVLNLNLVMYRGPRSFPQGKTYPWGISLLIGKVLSTTKTLQRPRAKIQISQLITYELLAKTVPSDGSRIGIFPVASGFAFVFLRHLTPRQERVTGNNHSSYGSRIGIFPVASGFPSVLSRLTQR